MEQLDVLAVAPLPYRLDGRGQFQLGGAFSCAELLVGLARFGHRVRALASGPQPSRPERGPATLLVAHGVPTAALPAEIYPPRAVRALLAHRNQVSSVVTVARHLEEILRHLGVESVERITTAIDTQVFRPRAKDLAGLAAHGIEPDRFVIGSFSHLRPEKRMLDLEPS